MRVRQYSSMIYNPMLSFWFKFENLRTEWIRTIHYYCYYVLFSDVEVDNDVGVNAWAHEWHETKIDDRVVNVIIHYKNACE